MFHGRKKMSLEITMAAHRARKKILVSLFFDETKNLSFKRNFLEMM